MCHNTLTTDSPKSKGDFWILDTGIIILKPVKKEQFADELYMLFDGALITQKVHREDWPIQTAKNLAERIL